MTQARIVYHIPYKFLDLIYPASFLINNNMHYLSKTFMKITTDFTFLKKKNLKMKKVHRFLPDPEMKILALRFPVAFIREYIAISMADVYLRTIKSTQLIYEKSILI